MKEKRSTMKEKIWHNKQDKKTWPCTSWKLHQRSKLLGADQEREWTNTSIYIQVFYQLSLCDIVSMT